MTIERQTFGRRGLFQGAVAAGVAGAGLGMIGSGGGASAAMNRTGMAPSGAKGLGPGGSILPPGTLPFPTMPAGTTTMPKIEHIVAIMMENHSFDDHFGMLGRGDGFTLGPNGRPVNYNPNPAGGYVRSFHNPNTVGYNHNHISQSWNDSHISWDKGTDMGFVKACGPAAMGYWTGDDLPFYYSMGKQFPIGDRYFCSVMAQTYPNRRFFIAATALGDVSTNGTGISSSYPPNGTIFESLEAHGLTWKDYYPDVPSVALFFPGYKDNQTDGKVVHFTQFYEDAATGNLPDFSIIDPYVNDSEENNDISIGEAYAYTFIDAVLKSPKWESTAIIWIYDEHGGWYDHVPPVPQVKPDNVAPKVTTTNPQPGAYDYSGFRVPCCVVSAWAKRDHVSHVTYDHTSVMKLVQTKWNLPALTYRDANAHPLTDFFDFNAKEPPFAIPPKLAKPKNPFVGTPPPSSLSQSVFHPIATAATGDGPKSALMKNLPATTRSLLKQHDQKFRK